MPGTRGSGWELMSAHVTRRCRSALSPQAPPEDSPPDQTGLSIPGWGQSPLQLWYKLCQPPGLSPSRGTAAQSCPRELPQEGSRCAVDPPARSALSHSGTWLFQKLPKRLRSCLALPEAGEGGVQTRFVREERRVGDARGSAPNRPRQLL